MWIPFKLNTFFPILPHTIAYFARYFFEFTFLENLSFKKRKVGTLKVNQLRSDTHLYMRCLFAIQLSADCLTWEILHFVHSEE